MKISKELFFEVKKFKEFDFDYCYNIENEEMEKGIECFYFRCKEWSNKNGYTIIDYIDIDNDEFWTCRAYPNGLNDGFDYQLIYQPSSQISVFAVCEWILNSKKEAKC